MIQYQITFQMIWILHYLYWKTHCSITHVQFVIPTLPISKMAIRFCKGIYAMLSKAVKYIDIQKHVTNIGLDLLSRKSVVLILMKLMLSLSHQLIWKLEKFLIVV